MGSENGIGQVRGVSPPRSTLIDSHIILLESKIRRNEGSMTRPPGYPAWASSRSGGCSRRRGDVRGRARRCRPPARPRSRVAGFWVLALRRRRSAPGFTSAFAPRFGVDGLSGFFLGTLGAGRGAGARLLAPLPGAGPAGAARSAALTAAVRARARAASSAPATR